MTWLARVCTILGGLLVLLSGASIARYLYLGDSPPPLVWGVLLGGLAAAGLPHLPWASCKLPATWSLAELRDKVLPSSDDELPQDVDTLLRHVREDLLVIQNIEQQCQQINNADARKTALQLCKQISDLLLQDKFGDLRGETGEQPEPEQKEPTDGGQA